MDHTEFFQRIKDKPEGERVSPRTLINYLGYSRRGKWVCQHLDRILAEFSLETNPYWADVWIDQEVQVLPIPTPTALSKARTKVNGAIKRINILDEANKAPDYVKPEDSIIKATTLMLQNGYSQLPVSSNSLQEGSIQGYISWRSIALKQISGNGGDTVKDYLDKKVCIIPSDTPILEAMESVHKHGFILVSDQSKKICGMITAVDMSSTYKLLTEQFLLIEQIERQVRLLLDDQYTLAEINALISTEEGQQEVQSIDDLTFGQYVRIIESPDNWAKLNLFFDKDILHGLLGEVRDIRNDIMHFDPAGIDSEQLDKLSEICRFLTTVIKLSRERDC